MMMLFSGLSRYKLVVLMLSVSLPIHTVNAESIKWDYVNRPVRVTANKPSICPFMGPSVARAFDGYGAQGAKPAAIRAWETSTLPTPEEPLFADIDYGRPIAVSAFVHYFYVPGCRDLRTTSPAPSAFRTVRISSKNDMDDWSEVVVLNDLPADCPQILSVNASIPARYWRIEVLEMAQGAENLCSYEIETYQGGIPEIHPWEIPGPDFLTEFNERILSYKPANTNLISKIDLSQHNNVLDIAVKDRKTDVTGTLTLLVDGKSCELKKTRKNIWKTSIASGDIFLDVKQTKMGLLFNWTFQASSDNPIKHLRASVQMSAPDIDLYYIPAYVWSTTKPEDRMLNMCTVQTRMAAIETKKILLMLVPGTDRGEIGFTNGAVQNNMLIGEEPTPTLITAIRGDWWTAYQFAVNDIYNFTEPQQTVPVSEIQQGISTYLMQDEVWEPTLGTLRSWPAEDPQVDWVGFECFAFYGVPYSIPTYWARYVMNNDKAALKRCKSIAHWLCDSGVRVQEGPARGAFFTLQRFRYKTPVTLTKQGCTQADHPILTTQSTGAALWSLLYYRKVTGDKDPKIDRTIDEAAAWLLKTQKPDGGWPYAYNTNGIEYGLEQKPLPAPSAGCIWNIWALWRLGNETHNQHCLDAAERATSWFHETYIKPHFYHGYWEDVGPNTREGYEAAIAAVAFGEMGKEELMMETARDAIQWVFTRQIECRDVDCSAGLASEQFGWPPATYCNPMMGLAAWNAWQISKDEFWKTFARIPKAIGWWYQPQRRAMVWIIEAVHLAPIVGPCSESWWLDWINAQTSSLTLRWLVREVNLRSGGEIQIDEELLCGRANQRDVKLWAPPGGLHPILPPDGQVNWLGFRGEDSILIAFMNDGNKGEISCPLDSRDVQGASLCPKKIYSYKNKKTDSRDWDGSFPLRIEADEMIALEWRIKP